MGYHQTALSLFRMHAALPTQSEGMLSVLLRSHLEDKGYSIDALCTAQHSGELNFAQAAHHYLLRAMTTPHMSAEALKLVARMALSSPNADGHAPMEAYDGSAEHDAMLARSLNLASGATGQFTGEGAATHINIGVDVVTGKVADTPIAIIGQGAAGIFVYTALRRLGFHDITVFEKRGKLGIWGQPNVAGGTKNNPRPIHYTGVAELGAAAGDGTKDGATIPRFLTSIDSEYSNTARKLEITRVESGELDHRVHYEELDEKGRKQQIEGTFPIVINCTGWGEPRPLHDSTRMAFRGEEPKLMVRWQQGNLKHADIDGKRFVFVGLGNSTAEMVTQIYDLQSKGAACDFCVLTHYPLDAVANPFDAVSLKDRTYRVFRDQTKPELTAFQGDLLMGRRTYMRMLAEDRIISDVTEWSASGDHIGFKRRRDSGGEHKFDKLHVLTGYRHSKTAMDSMGIESNIAGEAMADFDGEFQTERSDNRYVGHFGMGAVLNAQHRKNAVVMPGMAFMLPDMLFGVAMRAAEHAYGRK